MARVGVAQLIAHSRSQTRHELSHMLRDAVHSEKQLTALGLSNTRHHRHVLAYPFFRYHSDDFVTNAAHEFVYVPLLFLTSRRSSQHQAAHRVSLLRTSQHSSYQNAVACFIDIRWRFFSSSHTLRDAAYSNYPLTASELPNALCRCQTNAYPFFLTIRITLLQMAHMSSYTCVSSVSSSHTHRVAAHSEKLLTTSSPQNAFQCRHAHAYSSFRYH